MNKMTLSLAMLVLMLSVSAAEATPIRGTFTGVVTDAWSYDPNYLLFPVGTPAWAIFGYDSAYLSPPDEFGNRYTSYLDGYEGFFSGKIGDNGNWVTFGTNGWGGLWIGPNGLPFFGTGNGAYDVGVFSNGFSFTTMDYSAYVVVEGTYSLPEHQSTLAATVVGLIALAVSRRFLSRVPSM